MRIIAGKHKGRTLSTLAGLNTRPMMDRMKESVFNIIGPFFEGQEVLDLFGGSGALSLEAISRGAKSSHIVDSSKAAVDVIKENVKNLHEEDKVFIHLMDYERSLAQFKSHSLVFDIIFLDPPYRMAIMDEIITFLLKENMIADGGNIICQYQRNSYVPKEYEGMRIVKNYSYAISEITIYEFQKK